MVSCMSFIIYTLFVDQDLRGELFMTNGMWHISTYSIVNLLVHVHSVVIWYAQCYKYGSKPHRLTTKYLYKILCFHNLLHFMPKAIQSCTLSAFAMDSNVRGQSLPHRWVRDKHLYEWQCYNGSVKEIVSHLTILYLEIEQDNIILLRALLTHTRNQLKCVTYEICGVLTQIPLDGIPTENKVSY